MLNDCRVNRAFSSLSALPGFHWRLFNNLLGFFGLAPRGIRGRPHIDAIFNYMLFYLM